LCVRIASSRLSRVPVTPASIVAMSMATRETIDEATKDSDSFSPVNAVSSLSMVSDTIEA